MSTRQEFLTNGRVRLLIERDRATGESQIPNRLYNTDGTYGGYGWLTPVADTFMRQKLVGFTYNLELYVAAPGTSVRFFSQRVFLQSGQWVRAQWKERPGTAGHRGSYAFFDAAGALLSTTTASAYYKATTDTLRTLPAVQAPTNTSYVRLRIDVYGNSSNANPSNGTSVIFNNAFVGVADTAAGVDLTDTIDVLWNEEVLASCTEVNVARVAGQIGTLTARVVSNALDPAFNTLLRPGRRVRLEYLESVGNNPTPIFVGITGRPDVEYGIDKAGKQFTVTTLTAYDAFQQLAATRAPNGYRDIANLVGAFESMTVPVPWKLNGNDAQGFSLPADATDDGASLLDQVIRTRDTNLGAAWTSREGVVWVADPDHTNDTVRDTWTEADYNAAIKVTYDVEAAINRVEGSNLSRTTSTPFGPAQSRASIAAWGELSASFTTIDHPDPGALALTIIQGNAGSGGTLIGNEYPVRMIQSVQVAMGTLADVDRYGLRDLWDLVHVSSATFGLGDDYRISSITHSIKADNDGDKWLITFGLAVANRAPIPTV